MAETLTVQNETPESYERTKDVVITKMELVCENETYDILLGFVEMSIYESIYDTHMTGNIVISESFNIPEKGPIVGNEQLVVSFRTSGETDMKTFSKTFDVFKMDERTVAIHNRTQSYVLHFASPQQDNNQKTIIQRSFKDMTEDEVVSIVAKHQLGIDKLTTEGCRHRSTFVVPAWRPYDLINYCAKTAVRPTGDSPCNYFFYEDIDGFNFVSLDSLMEKEPTATFSHQIARLSKAQQVMPFNVESFTMAKNFDTLIDSTRGMYGSKLTVVDFVAKSIEVKETSYEARFSGTVHAEEFPVRTSSPTESERFFQCSSNYLRASSIPSYMMNRPMDIQQFEHWTFNVTVNGSTNLKLGDKITFDLPKFDHSVESGIDEKLSGDYLATSIRHLLTRSEHNMMVELRKPNLKS